MANEVSAKNGRFVHLWRVCLFTWTTLIGIGTFLPQGNEAAGYFTLGGRDFFAHLAAYGVLTVLTVLALQGLRHKWRILAAFFFPVLLSVATESLQPLVGRAFQAADMLANGIGVTLGLGAGAFTMLFLERKFHL